MTKWTLLICVAMAAIAGAPAFAEDTPTDQARIEKLEADLKAALERIDALEKQIASMKPTAATPRVAKPVKAVEEPYAADTKWQGTISSAGSNLATRITGTVTAREGSSFTLRTETEKHAIWDWECKLVENRFDVVSVNRVRAEDGVTNIVSLSGITGGGAIVNGQMTLKYDWPVGTDIRHVTIVMRKR